jgi:hypothetical protein
VRLLKKGHVRVFGHYEVVDKLFETAVFLSPLLDFGQEIHRDVNGMGFAFDLPGQIMAHVLLATGAMTTRVAASAAERDEAGGQDRTLGLEFFLSGLEGAADQGGMGGYFHRMSNDFSGPDN